MIVFESLSVRRVVGRLARGEHVPEAFRAMAADRSITTGSVQALGALEWVELVEYDQAAQVYRPSRRIEAPCEILSFIGNISLKEGRPFVHLHATVSRETETGIEVLGGHLVDGQVFACEFVVECFDDLRLQREMESSTGLALWTVTQAKPPRVEAATEPQAVSWAQVSAASVARDKARAERTPLSRRESRPPRAKIAPGAIPERAKTSDAEFFEEPVPQKGDYVSHAQFGLCRIDGHDAEGHLILRLESGRRKAINLDYLRVLPPRTDDRDRRIFPLEPRKK